MATHAITQYAVDRKWHDTRAFVVGGMQAPVEEGPAVWLHQRELLVLTALGNSCNVAKATQTAS